MLKELGTIYILEAIDLQLGTGIPYSEWTSTAGNGLRAVNTLAVARCC